MNSLSWYHRPKLRQPVLVSAFEGWNDAGDAASTVARWLADRYGATIAAVIDPEEFFDFTSTRPIIEREATMQTVIWPETELWACSTDGPRDLVVMVGHEPHLRWRTFTKIVIEAAEALECSMAITLGALLTDVPHTRPTVITATSHDNELIEKHGLIRPTYQGPTGIVGVLYSALEEAEMPTASLWASVPAYVSGASSPRAALALLERTCSILGISQPAPDLEKAAQEYDRQINELMESDEDTASYVAMLEAALDENEEDEHPSHPALGNQSGPADSINHPEPPPEGLDNSSLDDDPDALVDEVERFLRGD
ncbi:MAG: PAC2 family protein [Acidimicrobiales bacterium]|nr:PAC2 family protein [Acidimicrobiales bacterium]